MRYFAISFIIHIFAVISISSSIASNSQQNYEVYFQSPQNESKSLGKPVLKKSNLSIKQITSAPSLDSQSNSITKDSNTSDSDNTQGIISLNGQAGPTQSIFNYLVSQIYENRIYPHESVRLKQQGQVTVRFYINQNGEITDVQVANPSLHKLLNQAAIRTLDRIKINKQLPEIERLYNRSYSFTFDYEITKSSS